jgi:replicative DNA helicase
MSVTERAHRRLVAAEEEGYREPPPETDVRPLETQVSHAPGDAIGTQVLDGEGEYVDRRGLPGGDAILDLPDEVPAVWGEGSEVLWAEGEPCMIAAPAGVGKTTVAQQVTLGLIGLRTELLGYPFHGAPRRVLYLAMDRPRQIRRSFRRMVTEDDRATLNEYLTIREGPPPADLASDPTLLVQLARWHNASVIVVDSLKDAAVKLTDDETGGKANRAIQYATAEGIDVLVLHHQRKGQNGEKPKKLEDVYGSTWITAGMGSVILLWGAAGDPIVELVHLKQPAEAVGPLKLEHDQTRGTTSVHRGFDVLRFLSLNPKGVTSRQAAVAMFEKSTPTDNELRKARRKLEAAVDRGIAVRDGGEKGGEGGSSAAIYRPAGTLS